MENGNYTCIRICNRQQKLLISIVVEKSHRIYYTLHSNVRYCFSIEHRKRIVTLILLTNFSNVKNFFNEYIVLRLN